MAKRARFGQLPPYVDHQSAKQKKIKNLNFIRKTTTREKIMMTSEILLLKYMQDVQGNYLTHA